MHSFFTVWIVVTSSLLFIACMLFPLKPIGDAIFKYRPWTIGMILYTVACLFIWWPFIFFGWMFLIDLFIKK